MLMITVEDGPAVVTLRLAGQLGTIEARELARTRSELALTYPDVMVLFDLTGVTAVDRAGKEWLSQAHRNGDRLVGGAITRSIVDEMVARTSGNRSIQAEKLGIRVR
jgi:anti-anti-sigma regulatory factor